MKKAVDVVLKIIATVLLICVTVNIATYFADSDAYFRGKVRLSTLNDEECKQFLWKEGVTIPEEFSDLNFQYFFSSIEDDPDVSFIYGHTPLVIFLEEIRDVVIKYYRIEP